MVFAVLAVVLGPLAAPALAIEASNVLLLYYDDAADTVTDGEAIRDHYLSVHGSAVRTLGLTFDAAPTEEITAQEYLDEIRRPILDSGLLTEDVEVIVTTRGLPLRIDNAGSGTARFSSLESELTRIDSISTVPQMQDGAWILADFGFSNILPANPYYLGPNVGTGVKKEPVGFDRSANEGIRLTSRLDGYTASDAIAAIDRASGPIYAVTHQNYLIVDDDASIPSGAFDVMAELYNDVVPLHYPDADPTNGAFETDFAGYDDTPADTLDTAWPAIAYVGHGTKSGLTPGTLGQLDTTGYVFDDFLFDLADGAVFHSYESFNAYSFEADQTFSGQGQVAQWIAAGGTAGLGTVAEPVAGPSNNTNEDVFFDMMLRGYTFAEAAWAATRQLSFVNTAVGDPLLRYTPWVRGDFNVDGSVDITDLSIMQSNWSQAGGFAQGDANGDGQVDLFDLIILQANWAQSVFGATPATLTASTGLPVISPITGAPVLVITIPEPASLGLCVALLPIASRRRGRR